MSHTRVKTKYQVQGAYGASEDVTLYAHHNNSCDVVTFYDEDGDYIFSVEDTERNNMMDAIERLYRPFKDNELDEGVEYYNNLQFMVCSKNIYLTKYNLKTKMSVLNDRKEEAKLFTCKSTAIKIIKELGLNEFDVKLYG